MLFRPDTSYEELKAVSKSLWDFFIPHFALLKKHRDKILNEWPSERRKSYKLDHHLFYLIGMELLYPIFQRSDLFKMFPSSITPQDMAKKSHDFLGDGERYDYYRYLLDRNTYYQKNSQNIELKTSSVSF